ncbi:uncharacterized protein METZ01_LOCUS249209, partial [marine metagenome]
VPIRKIINTGMVPLHIYTDQIEEKAMKQLENVSMLSLIHHHVAVMPDVHW